MPSSSLVEVEVEVEVGVEVGFGVEVGVEIVVGICSLDGVNPHQTDVSESLTLSPTGGGLRGPPLAEIAIALKRINILI